jgi:putative Mn2+ efflux pump MntP
VFVIGIVELFFIALGLSMDAFAVALCKGLNMRVYNRKYSFLIAAFFGGFQALMPLVGWLLGTQFARYIRDFDHWVAFALLAFIGGKMVYESFKKEDCCGKKKESFDLKELLMLSVATSIDALAAGVTFAFLSVNIFGAVLLIGAVTFILSASGVAIGNRFGIRYKNKAELAGGLALIFMGIKILLEHLDVL